MIGGRVSFDMTVDNVFVLCTGRCGSTTFAAACEPIENFTVGHESRVNRVGAERLAYPTRHIEVDNRLSWLLGRLGEAFPGPETLWVHLRRNDEATARSFTRRWGRGIIRAYAKEIVPGATRSADRHEICLDYCRTVNANIEAFLRTRERSCRVRLEEVDVDFPRFLDAAGATGDRTAAQAAWAVRHNAS